MPPRPRVDPAFVKAIARRARRGMDNADIVRDLQRLTPKLGPAPSYHTVRRVAALARPSGAGMNPYLDELIVKLLTGRFPDFYAVDARLEFERYVHQVTCNTSG